MIYIYKLINPIIKKPYYIGASANPLQRLRAHISTPNCKTGKELRISKIKPIIEVIESVEDSVACERETFWINELIKNGYDIENKPINGGRKKFKNKIKILPEETIIMLKRIGQRIKNEMDSRKWSVYKLAKESKVSITPLQSILNGTANYTVDSLCNVCNVLGITNL